jgi:hypothetical protein
MMRHQLTSVGHLSNFRPSDIHRTPVRCPSNFYRTSVKLSSIRHPSDSRPMSVKLLSDICRTFVCLISYYPTSYHNVILHLSSCALPSYILLFCPTFVQLSSALRSTSIRHPSIAIHSRHRTIFSNHTLC